MPIRERSRRLVNVREFHDTGNPERVQFLNLQPPTERQYILRMAVRAEGGEYRVPSELEWVKPLLFAARRHQWDMEAEDHPFCYITVRHGVVESQTDDEWHVDGFSTRVPHVPEQNYVWCSAVGTEYVPLSVDFPADFDPLKHNVNHYLTQFIDPQEVDACVAGHLYCFDPYILHRRPPATAGTVRTFVRVSFVPIEINDVNNTQNPVLYRSYNRDGVEHRNTLADYK